MRTRTVGAGLAALLVLAACGTRLPDEAFVEGGAAAVASDGTLDGGDGVGAVDPVTGEPIVGGVDPVTGEPTVGTDGGTDGGGTGGTGGAVDPGGTTGGSGGTGGTGGTGGGTGGAPAASGPNQASDVGITATTITLGNITAESGVLGDAFAPAVRGLRAWVQATNAKGGINGRTIVLKTCDDQENRSRSLACARRLVEEDKVFALVATNTRALGGAAQYLDDKGVPVIGIPITNSFNRYPHFWSVYGSSYPRNGDVVGHKGQLVSLSGTYRWFNDNLGVTKAAVFSYDIAESKQAGSFLQKGLELEGFTVTPYVVSFAAASFDQAVADMQQKGIQIIFDAMDDGANRKLCDAMARRRFSVEAKVSTIVSMGDSVGNDYNDTCRNSVYIAGSSAAYTSTNIPAVAEFRQAFGRYQPGQEVHQWALEAWAQATMVAEGIAKMGPAPTRKGLEEHLRSLRKYSAGGIMTGTEYVTGNLDAPTREHCFSIARWQDSKKGWVDATGRFPFCYANAKQYATPTSEQGN